MALGLNEIFSDRQTAAASIRVAAAGEETTLGSRFVDSLAIKCPGKNLVSFN
jgi:hypothetical protein